MGLVDSHCHLTYPGLCERIPEVLSRCRDAGVDRMITIGTSPADAREAVALAERHLDVVHAAVGCHPHHAGELTEEGLRALAMMWDHPGVVACGEMGLDYHYDFAERTVQRKVFEAQLRLCSPRLLPLIIHCREAFDDTIALLVDHGLERRAVVFHCFTGTQEEARRVADYGWRISFTGAITFKKSTWLREIAKNYPSDQLMVETDSPYLSPEPVRGQRPNEPANVAHIAKFLAQLRDVPYETLVKQTTENTIGFFKFPTLTHENEEA